MAEASKTVVMDLPAEKIWKVIVDYANYGEFVDGVQKVDVKSRKGGKARVHYAIEMMGKEIFYVLDHSEENEKKMTWTMVESNVMKSNTGGWTLKDLGGGKTEVTYELALEFNIPVPGFVLSGLVKSSLPKMLASFEKRARSL